MSAQWTATSSHALTCAFSSPPTYWIGFCTCARSGSRRGYSVSPFMTRPGETRPSPAPAGGGTLAGGRRERASGGGRGGPLSAQLREEQRDLAGGGLVGVRAVHDVVLHLEAEVAADGGGGGLHRVGGTGQGTERLDGPRALDDQREQCA